DIVGYDPKANETAREVLGEKIQYANSMQEALKGSECAFLITEWDEFKQINPEFFKTHMKSVNLVDGRRIYDFNEFSTQIPFRTIGRR
ncbi:MAG: UDP-glucose 6-dehydrogenase, partial [Promethearchaeota archaeon]